MAAISSNPEKWTCALLKEFCISHNLKRSGRKADLLARVHSFLAENSATRSEVLSGDRRDEEAASAGASKASATSTTDHGMASASSSAATMPAFPSAGWKTLQASRTSCPEFSMVTMLSLFLDGRRGDGLPNANFKAIVGDNKAIRLFQAGYVSKIRLVRDGNKVYFSAQCQPEMRSAADYQIRFIVESSPQVGKAVAGVEKFLFSQCSCAAGKGPLATCKHIAAVLYGLEEFCRLGFLKEAVTCTERLQQWNKPHGKKVMPMAVDEMDFRKSSLGKQLNKDGHRSRPKLSAAALSDPRPRSKRGQVQGRIELLLGKRMAAGNDKMNCLALAAGSQVYAEAEREKRLEHAKHQKALWHQQHTVVASADVDIDSESDGETDSNYSWAELSDEEFDVGFQIATSRKCDDYPLSITEFYSKFVVITKEQAAVIEATTRCQSECAEWFDQRRFRVTATICKEIVCRKKPDMQGLVRRKLKQSFFGNTATRYGLEHEPDAIAEYTALMKEGDPECSVNQSGLVVSCEKPYLACSPDGIVSCREGKGLVEVKCPHSCHNIELAAMAARQPSFFLGLSDGQLSLKPKHKYYYQVQMSLLVTGLEWADLVVWTPAELFVERIHRNKDLLLTAEPKLSSFYHDHLLPALFAAMRPTPRVREVQRCIMHCTLLPRGLSQSTIDGRNGSSACTVIAAQVVHKVLAGAIVQLHPSHSLPPAVVQNFIECMRTGNTIYDNANLGGQLLSVYDALDLLAHTGLIVAPRGDIGCRLVGDLSKVLLDLTARAHDQHTVLAGLLVQTPFTVAVSISPERVVTLFDSHLHGLEDGAMIASTTCDTVDDSTKVVRFVEGLIGTIKDCHLCLLFLKTF